VVVAIKEFTEVAHTAAKAGGAEDLRIAEYPVAIGIQEPDEITGTVKEFLFDKIIDGLTKPTQGGGSTATGTVWNPKEIVFRGTLDQVNGFFGDKEWTDGLPVIPPTIERVEKFLRFTNRSPDEVIAVLPQANLKAVPWNIAANAVMAGCWPEYMPLFIAAVEAIADEHYNLENIGTTGTLLPFLLINGPIIRQLGIEYGGQLISRGPNPAIGRAISLIIRNIGGYRPGRNYMGTFGYQSVFALAENEEESPWEPFHVEHGFDRDASTVTAGGTVIWGYPPAPESRPEKSGAQATLEMLCRELYKKTVLHSLPERGEDAFPHMITLLITPPVARSLADAGYSKHNIREYLYENARVSHRELEWHTKYSFAGSMTIREKVEQGLFSEEYLVGPDDMVRVLSSPEMVHIVVCGDPSRNRVMGFDGVYVRPSTKEIELPANWDELLREAREQRRRDHGF
jgi:hypothetical protein